MRLGAALERAYPQVPQCIYRFMFSDGLSFGFPPQPYALDAFLRLLADEALDAPWMIAGLDVNITPSMAYAADAAGTSAWDWRTRRSGQARPMCS